MSDSTRQMLEEQVDAQLAAWVEALDHVDEDRDDEGHPADCEPCESYDEDADRYDVLNTEALEVTYQWAGPDRASATVHTVTIVLATGGPHVEISVRRDSGAEIVGYWSGAKVARYVDHDATLELAEELAELAEMSA